MLRQDIFNKYSRCYHSQNPHFTEDHTYTHTTHNEEGKTDI